MLGDRVGITKWAEGDRVALTNDYGDKVVATVAGESFAAAQFVFITWPGGHADIWQDELRLATPEEIAALGEPWPGETRPTQTEERP
jgi:hypothetical protein